MGILTRTTAAELRQRAEVAELAAADADRHASVARAEAAGFLADGNAEAARRARSRAIELATEAETQRDLAAELRRRADETAKVERIAAYNKARIDAAKASAEAERLIRSLLDDMGPRMGAAQKAQQLALARFSAVMNTYLDLPEREEVEPPAPGFDPIITNGPSLTTFGALSVWRIA